MRPSDLHIIEADPQGTEALRLLHEAADEARQLYPEFFDPTLPGPTNGPTPLRGVYLLAAAGCEVVGMGAHRPVDALTTEVRRMFVTLAHRRLGVAWCLLGALEAHAANAGFTRMVLETGCRQAPAMRLYETCGYRRIAPFGPYVNDPTSVCYEKLIATAVTGST